MKLLLKNSIYFAAIGIFGFSCSEPELKQQQTSTQLTKTELIYFKGEKVLVPINFPKELFNQTQEDFDKYYADLEKNENLRTSGGEETLLTATELNSIVSTFIEKYPDLSINKEIKPSDLSRIYTDFPDIKSIDKIRDKSDIIVAYYEAFLKKETIPAVIKYKKEKGKTNLRINAGIGDPFGIMYKHEEEIALNHPRYVPGYTLAITMAQAMGGRFGPYDVGTKGDALRHAA